MIIWLGQKLWLFGSGKNYDYLAQAQIMIIWLRHKLWKFDSSQNYENVALAPNHEIKKNLKAFSTIQTATQVLHGSVVPAVHVLVQKA